MRIFYLWFGSLLALPAMFAADQPLVPASPLKAENGPKFVFSLIPKSLSKNPFVNMTVFTEMTEAGKKLPLPTSDNPTYYEAQPGGYHVLGESYAGLKPPPQEMLEQVMKKALAADYYLPAAAPAHAPTLLVIYQWGMHGKLQPQVDEDTGETLENPYAGIQNLYDRAALVGGDKFAKKLIEANVRANSQAADLQDAAPQHMAPGGQQILTPEAIAMMSTQNDVQRMYDSSPNMAELMEQTNDDVYFVVASAYDYAALGQKKRLLLWRTKMTVDTKGVSMADTLPAVITAATPYFGREMTEATALSKRVVRQGNVEIGPLKVEEYDQKPATPAPAKPKEKKP